MPLRAKLYAGAAILGTLLVSYLVTIRVVETPSKPTPAVEKAQQQPVPKPAAPAIAQEANLARDIGDAAAISEKSGVVRIELRNDRQFASGTVRPAAELRPLLERVAKALDRAPGAIMVTGHADANPARNGSNQALSLSRARAVAGLLSGMLADPKRVRAEGKGDAEPVVPNDSAANRAKNRRVVIEVRKAP